jgi:cell volume regulation protein A
MFIERVLLIVAILLLVSVFASKASGRLGVPALVIFLGIGMLAGSDGIGGIYFDDAFVAQFVGVMALAFILFAGGLDTDWRHVRPVLTPALLLATLGVFISAGVVGLFAWQVLGFSLLEGMLLGAIVSSTDAAAVFTAMRARATKLKGQVEPLLELESGSNDPMAVFLTAALTMLLVTPGASVLGLAPQFVWQMGAGIVLGLAFGWLAVQVINHVRLQVDGLYVVLTISTLLLAYAGTALLGGNGFLAVYIAGIFMGQQNFVHKRSLGRFHDGMAWLMQIAMFLTLGLLVFPSQLPAVAGPAIAAALVLVFVARPITVFLCLALSRFNWREKLLISWVGLRGAVPIILATFPLLAGVPKADTIFNHVFFIVLVSVLLQGTTISLVARWLGLQAPPTRNRMSLSEHVANAIVEIPVNAGSQAAGKQVVELGLPSSALIVSIAREGETFVPNGSTVLEPDDVLLVVSDPATCNDVRRQLT